MTKLRNSKKLKFRLKRERFRAGISTFARLSLKKMKKGVLGRKWGKVGSVFFGPKIPSRFFILLPGGGRSKNSMKIKRIKKSKGFYKSIFHTETAFFEANEDVRLIDVPGDGSCQYHTALLGLGLVCLEEGIVKALLSVNNTNTLIDSAKLKVPQSFKDLRKAVANVLRVHLKYGVAKYVLNPAPDSGNSGFASDELCGSCSQPPG